MSLKDKLIREKLPEHVAIIMDGNGRWAIRKGAAWVIHESDVKSYKDQHLASKKRKAA